LYFEDCRIPGDRIVGVPGTGFKTALATLDHTGPTIGAQAVGIAQGALDAAIAYTKERKQFGKRISDFEAVQFMLADMAMKVEAARLMVYTAAARAERGELALGFLASASKCFASGVAMEVTTDAVQLLGGYIPPTFPLNGSCATPRSHRSARDVALTAAANRSTPTRMAQRRVGLPAALCGACRWGYCFAPNKFEMHGLGGPPE
jgi:alkylation response protein AidB-like acyl-CoA dehydrogenase